MIKVLLIGWLIGFCSVRVEAQPPNLEALKRRLASIVAQSSLEQKHLGLVVSVREEVQEFVLLETNANRTFTPASLTKLVTAGAVLDQLGPGHTFKTQLLSSSITKNGVIEGDIYLKGGGDPSFTSESMWVLINDFVRSGVQVIQGNIIVDDSRFDSVRFDPGRDPHRVDRAYDAPIGAMSFNWNSVNVHVRPGAKVGEQAKVYLDPNSEYVELENHVQTTEGRGQNLRASRKKSKSAIDKIVVRGNIGINADEKTIYKSISRPELWSGYHLKAFLMRRGIEVSGEVKAGSTPLGAKVMAELESKPLASIVSDMMKFSNNYVAEMLTKNLAAEAGQGSASMAQGMVKLEEFLRRHGVTEKQMKLVNPSGLSRRNAIRPKALHELMLKLKGQFNIQPEFMSSLPIAGVDGTLKRRFNGGPGVSWVRAKTGLLSGVAGLAGFAGNSAGRVATFVLIFNGPAGKAPAAKNLFDKMAEELVKP